MMPELIILNWNFFKCFKEIFCRQQSDPGTNDISKVVQVQQVSLWPYDSSISTVRIRFLRERWRAEWGGERAREIFKNWRLLFYTTCVSGGAVGVLRGLPHQLPSFTPVCQELSISLTCIQLEGRSEKKSETRCFLPFYWRVASLREPVKSV